jgi:hypothetical protein
MGVSELRSKVAGKDIPTTLISYPALGLRLQSSAGCYTFVG